VPGRLKVAGKANSPLIYSERRSIRWASSLDPAYPPRRGGQAQPAAVANDMQPAGHRADHDGAGPYSHVDPVAQPPVQLAEKTPGRQPIRGVEPGLVQQQLPRRRPAQGLRRRPRPGSRSLGAPPLSRARKPHHSVELEIVDLRRRIADQCRQGIPPGDLLVLVLMMEARESVVCRRRQLQRPGTENAAISHPPAVAAFEQAAAAKPGSADDHCSWVWRNVRMPLRDSRIGLAEGPDLLGTEGHLVGATISYSGGGRRRVRRAELGVGGWSGSGAGVG
jgi:hypothetical protein